MRQKRKIVSLLMAICMVFLLFPAVAKPVQAATTVKRTEVLSLHMNQHTYMDYMSTDGTKKTVRTIDGDITDSAEGWQWYLDGNSELGYEPRTLVLDGLNLEVSANNTGCISLPSEDANIVIKGNNTITNTCSVASYAYGIYVPGQNVSISGTGCLNITLSATCENQGMGIQSTGNVTVKDATLTVFQTDAVANTPSDGYYGIKANNITLENAIVQTSMGGGGNSYGLGAQGEFKLSGASSIWAAGTTTAITAATADLSEGYLVLGKDAKGDYTAPGSFANGMLVETATPTAAIKDVKIVKTYTVSYDGNGNTGGKLPAAEEVLVIDSIVTVKDNTGALKRDGYTFAGWNTAADGSGADYAADDTFKLLSDTTLFAQWKEIPETYTITYDGNGNTAGTVPTDQTAYEKDAAATVLGNSGSLSKDGYTFAGWNTAADGNGTDYTEGNTLTVSGDATLYAKWTAAAANPTPENTTTTPATSTKVPKTSDTSMFVFWLIAFALAGGVCVGVRKRTQR